MSRPPKAGVVLYRFTYRDVSDKQVTVEVEVSVDVAVVLEMEEKERREFLLRDPAAIERIAKESRPWSGPRIPFAWYYGMSAPWPIQPDEYGRCGACHDMPAYDGCCLVCHRSGQDRKLGKPKKSNEFVYDWADDVETDVLRGSPGLKGGLAGKK